MKKIYRNNLVFLLLSIFMCWGCTSYLEVPSEAAKDEKDIFGDYYNFQAYVDQLYGHVPDPIKTSLTSDASYGGECLSTTTWCTSYNAPRGLYRQFQTRGYLSGGTNDTEDRGIWSSGWTGIRKANVGLQGLKYFTGTQAEKDLIEGQLLFFRAFLHLEMLAAWGPIPYINEVLAEELDKPRYYNYKGADGYQACAEYINDDLELAAQKLPEVWTNEGVNRGRVTALAARAYQAKNLLYAGSPLMNESSGKTAVVNTDYMKRAALAAWKAIEIAEKNPATYGLMDWADYQKMFATTDGVHPWSKETIWGQYSDDKGKGVFDNRLGRVHTPDQSVFGGNSVNTCPTQNYVDKFEMADGTLYKPEYDNDNSKRWNYRDPRFRRAIYVDRDTAGIKTPATILTLFNGGKTRSADKCQTPYFIHKCWPKGVNKTDGGTEYQNFRMMVPLMRLAEVYLMYAEAVNEGYGSASVKVDGASLTGLDAVDKVRLRAHHVRTTATGGAHGSFRAMILNERAVELCFEAGQYWYDIRRWKIGESLNGESLQSLDFDKNWTNFTRVEVMKRVFEKKHYWMPFPGNNARMFEDFPQNEGWD